MYHLTKLGKISIPLFASACLLICFGCCKPVPEPPEPTFAFSSNKVWAHRVNTFEEANTKSQLFQGLEIDLIFSESSKKLYLAHDPWDTLLNITLDEWFSSLQNPSKNWYWMDLKNFSDGNAFEFASTLIPILNKHNVFYKTICESMSHSALKVLKSRDVAVSLWVANTKDPYKRMVITDTAAWKKGIEDKIKELQPKALSCYYWMHPLLDTSFPNENILYWHTPAEYTPENVLFTQKLCRISNVKVVLVDYAEPVGY